MSKVRRANSNYRWIYWIALLVLILNPIFGLDITAQAPSEMEAGKWFNITVNLSSSEQGNFSVYSYVYRDLDVVSQGWTANLKEVHITENGTTSLSLEDMIKLGTPEGLYKLKVKCRCLNQTFNYTTTIKVVSTSKVFEENYLYYALLLVSIVGLILIYFSRR